MQKFCFSLLRAFTTLTSSFTQSNNKANGITNGPNNDAGDQICRVVNNVSVHVFLMILVYVVFNSVFKNTSLLDIAML